MLVIIQSFKLLCIFNMIICGFSKLLYSSTYMNMDHLDFKDNNHNLTIIIRINHKNFFQNYYSEVIHILRIMDQNDPFSDNILIFLKQVGTSKVLLHYSDTRILNEEYQELDSQQEWKYLTLKACNKIEMFCTQFENQTLIIFNSDLFQIYIFDDLQKDVKQEIIISSLPLAMNIYILNIYKKELDVYFYAKFNCYLQKEGDFYHQEVLKKVYLIFSYKFNEISIKLKNDNTNIMYEDQMYEVNFSQWILYLITLQDFKIGINIYFKNYYKTMVIYIDNHIQANELINFQNDVSNYVVFQKSNVIRFDNIMISGLIYQERQLNFCMSNCKICLGFVCQDDLISDQDLKISEDIQNSHYFLNYQDQNNCIEPRNINSFDVCLEWPKLHGEYCKNCQYLYKKIENLDTISEFIQQFNYQHYFQKIFDISIPFKIKFRTIAIKEQDLNIFIIKIKDTYLIYRTDILFYCEEGYTFKGIKCVKQQKKCQFDKEQCVLCFQFYSLQSKKCIRCQKYCLNCIIIEKTIHCLLLIDDHYVNEKGLIKKCDKNKGVLICQSRKVIIQSLTQMGHQVCQEQEQESFYYQEQQKCGTVVLKRLESSLFPLNYVNQLKAYNQKLEIQDMLFLQKQTEYEANSQLQLLIYHQQIARYFMQQGNTDKWNSKIGKFYHFEDLSQLKLTKDSIDHNKIVFQDIICYLGNTLFIQYQNQIFENLEQIYERSKLQFETVQFDIRFISSQPLMNVDEFIIDFDINQYPTTNFNLNITFQVSPSVLYKSCVRFIFYAHEITLNNLTYNVKQSCKSHISLIAQIIKINNLFINDSIIQNLFQINKYSVFQLHNMNIFKSYIENLVTINHGQTINASQITILQSKVMNLITIQSVQFVLLNQLLFKDCYFKNDTILIQDAKFEIGINEIRYYNVMLDFSQTIVIVRATKNIYLNIILYSDITICNSNFYSSTILFSEYTDFLNLSKIYIKNSYFEQQSLFNFKQADVTYISKLFILNATHYNHTVISAQLNRVHIEDFYFTTNKFYSSSLIVESGNIIYIFNMNIQHSQLNHSSIFHILGELMKLYQIQINNNYIGDCRRNLINIEKLPENDVPEQSLAIKNIILNNLFVQNSQLFAVRFFDLVALIKIRFINLKINNIDQKELILFQQVVRLRWESLKFTGMKIKSQAQQFILLKIEKQYLVIMDQLKFADIRTDQHQSQVVVISIKSQLLHLTRSYFERLINIQLMSTSSNALKLLNWKLKNIFTTEYLIYNERYKQFGFSDYLMIRDFDIDQINGQFLLLILDITSSIIINDITIQDYQNSLNFLQVLQQNGDQQNIKCSIFISNIKIFNNHYSNNNQGYLLLFQSLDEILIHNVYIENIDTQLLLIDQTKRLNISELFVKNIIKSDQLVQIVSQAYQLSIINTKILNSILRIQSVFKFLLTNNRFLIMQNVQMINITTLYSVFIVNSNSQYFQIINLQLANVSSSKSIIYSNTQILLQRSYIIGGFSNFLFHANQIKLTDTLITNVNKPSTLAESQCTQLKASEVVESQITYDDQTLNIENSLIIGNFVSSVISKIINYNYKQLNFFLSLNSGQSLFQLKQLQDSLFQFKFSNDNNYLYLPSGQDIQQYQYFDYKTFEYIKLYDSISFVSLYQSSKIQCNLTQFHNNQLIHNIKLVLLPGVNIINNLVVVLNPFYKDNHIQMDLICDQFNETITYRTLIKTFNCQLGEYMHNDQCKLCNIEDYLYSVGYNQANCLFMDNQKIEKLNIGQIKLHQGFWRYSVTNKYIELCENSNCLGGWKPGDYSCKIGHIGAVCSECDINNIRGDGSYGKIDNQCKLCYFDNSIYIKFFLLIVYQLTIVFVNQYTNKQQSETYLFMRIAKRKFTEIHYQGKISIR